MSFFTQKTRINNEVLQKRKKSTKTFVINYKKGRMGKLQTIHKQTQIRHLQIVNKVSFASYLSV